MFKALCSFSGIITMAKGETKKIEDEEIIKDLLNAGYIEKIKEEVKKDTKNILDNEIKKDVEKVVVKVEEEVKKISSKKKKK